MHLDSSLSIGTIPNLDGHRKRWMRALKANCAQERGGIFVEENTLAAKWVRKLHRVSVKSDEKVSSKIFYFSWVRLGDSVISTKIGSSLFEFHLDALAVSMSRCLVARSAGTQLHSTL